jgi:hypothetical protein
MKSTKFQILFHANGDHNDSLTRIITNHNEGKVEVDLELMTKFIRGRFACYPTITPETKIDHNVGKGQLDIYEGKDQKHTVTIWSATVEIPDKELQSINTEAVNQ